jgi:hypothetical protein
LDYKPTICATPKKSLNDTERYTVLVVDEQSSYAKQLLGTVKKNKEKKWKKCRKWGHGPPMTADLPPQTGLGSVMYSHLPISFSGTYAFSQ